MNWRPWRKTLLVLACIVALSPLLASGCLWPGRPESLGIRDGRLAECPTSPNCVSSFGEEGDSEHFMAPIAFSGSAQDALSTVVAVVEGMPRSTIVTRTADYVHVEFTSAWFRFVDDVEFLIDPETRLVHFRSASRAGYSDLGVNRERMESFARVAGPRLEDLPKAETP